MYIQDRYVPPTHPPTHLVPPIHPPTHLPATHSTSLEPPRSPLPSQPTHPPTHLPQLLRLFKGHRDAQVAWLQSPEAWAGQGEGAPMPPTHPPSSSIHAVGLYLVIYSPSRGTPTHPPTQPTIPTASFLSTFLAHKINTSSPNHPPTHPPISPLNNRPFKPSTHPPTHPPTHPGLLEVWRMRHGPCVKVLSVPPGLQLLTSSSSSPSSSSSSFSYPLLIRLRPSDGLVTASIVELTEA